MDKGIIIPPNTKDAVTPEARPGVKAGNPVIDLNEALRRKNEGDFERLIKELAESAKTTKQTLKDLLPYWREEINAIIKNKITSEQKIEPILDILLDYSMWGIGEKEFMRLNKYYSRINKKGSDEYKRMYKEP